MLSKYAPQSSYRFPSIFVWGKKKKKVSVLSNKNGSTTTTTGESMKQKKEGINEPNDGPSTEMHHVNDSDGGSLDSGSLKVDVPKDDATVPFIAKDPSNRQDGTAEGLSSSVQAQLPCDKEDEGRRPSNDSASDASIEQKLHVMNVVDLADENITTDACEQQQQQQAERILIRKFRATSTAVSAGNSAKVDDDTDLLKVIRMNLPPDPLIQTPFGERRLTYADYTASGRSLRFIEEYLNCVAAPMFANTHTEASATGLQTSHFREEARRIIMESLGADPARYELIFAGSGSTGAIHKLIGLLGINLPSQLKPFMKDIPLESRPKVLISEQEHHSNELMWRETIADVVTIATNDKGEMDLDTLERELRQAKGVEMRQLIIGSFSAGSNVTGLLNHPGKIASLCHRYGAFACFDYAAAAPYVQMNMGMNVEGDDLSYLDAIFISPHKFVGGPGTPGILCVRKAFAQCTGAQSCPPTIPGGGTVTVVWPGRNGSTCAAYEKELHHREEAGTPGIMESIRCGLVFHLRNLVGSERIEKLEGQFARRAVERWLTHGNIWIMGQEFTNIHSDHDRLSITSFNIRCVIDGKPLLKGSSGEPLFLHYHFVSALLNDLYGIQSRSGCSCAAPLGFRLFKISWEDSEQIAKLAAEGIHTKPGWCRINFNYFIDENEFDYLCSAVEQIATHGWKLLPLYALCLRTGMSWFNGVLDNGMSFNRKAWVRSLTELNVQKDGTVAWKELTKSKANRSEYLQEAMKIYQDASNLVRRALYRFRDLRRKDQAYPEYLEPLRRFALGSEILPHLGITLDEVTEAQNSVQAANPELNPHIVEVSLMTNRPRG